MQSIQEILPLAPLQRGLLFHGIYDPGSIDPYVVQLEYEVVGFVKTDIFWRAVERVVARHPNLGAAFAYRGLQDPVQVVFSTTTVLRRELDLSNCDPQQTSSIYQAAVQEDRALRFDVEQAPLFRFTLVKFGNERFRLLFTCHHLLIDGWSTATLIREISRAYDSGGHADALPPCTHFREYLKWLRELDVEQALRSWSAYLASSAESRVSRVDLNNFAPARD